MWVNSLPWKCRFHCPSHRGGYVENLGRQAFSDVCPYMVLMYHTPYDTAKHFIFQFFFLFGYRTSQSIILEIKKIDETSDL
jgi:hypothetical protein